MKRKPKWILVVVVVALAVAVAVAVTVAVGDSCSEAVRSVHTRQQVAATRRGDRSIHVYRTGD